jgi:beta-glucanase (GH16 family)
MEYRGREPNILVGSIHGPGHSGGNAISGEYQFSGYLNERYHVYSIEWDSQSIKWFIDGTRYHRVERSDLPEGARWVYDQPFFILLNVAVAGTWVGWVRVYELVPGG